MSRKRNSLGGQFIRADARPSGFPGGLTIGLGSADARRVVSAEGFDNRDPYEIINSPEDPDGLAGDVGSLGAGQAAAGSMIMTFGRTTAEAEATYMAHTAGTLVTDEDWFKQTVGADGILHVETSTPGDGAGVPGNTLNPHIEVFGTSPTVPLYIGTPISPGARNEVVHVTGLVPGTIYRIRVKAEGGTGGAYFLDPPLGAAAARQCHDQSWRGNGQGRIAGAGQHGCPAAGNVVQVESEWRRSGFGDQCPRQPAGVAETRAQGRS